MTRPVIGITTSWMEKSEFSKRPHFVVRDGYFKAVHNAGGIPIALPHINGLAEKYVDMIDGMLVPGGDFAYPTEWYINESSPYEPSPRLDSDITFIKTVLEKDKPFLGICAGMQVLGGIHGCKLTKNITKFHDSDIHHRKSAQPEYLAHKVNIEAGTLLSSITGASEFDVNSHHNEGIIEVSDPVIVNAVAPDGSIEGIEITGKKYALGIEWHPEFELTEYDKKIFSAFIEASR